MNRRPGRGTITYETAVLVQETIKALDAETGGGRAGGRASALRVYNSTYTKARKQDGMMTFDYCYSYSYSYSYPCSCDQCLSYLSTDTRFLVIAALVLALPSLLSLLE